MILFILEQKVLIIQNVSPKRKLVYYCINTKHEGTLCVKFKKLCVHI